MDDTKKILFYGASNVKIIKPFLPDEVKCESFPGYTSWELLKTGPIIEDTYDLIVISAGTNDFTMFLPETLEALRALKLKCGYIPCVFLTTPHLKLVNKAIIKEFNYIKLPKRVRKFYIDRIHLSEDGAILVAQKILDYAYGL